MNTIASREPIVPCKNWMVALTARENEQLLDLLARFTNERIRYGNYRIVVTRGVVKCVECSRSVQVKIDDNNGIDDKSPVTNITSTQSNKDI